MVKKSNQDAVSLKEQTVLILTEWGLETQLTIAWEDRYASFDGKFGQVLFFKFQDQLNISHLTQQMSCQRTLNY